CVSAGRCTPATCAAAGARSTAVVPRGAANARVTCVDLQQATSYCAFVGERLPSEDEWEHAARTSRLLGELKSLDDAAEWTATPYCYFCNRDDQVVRGGPARNPGLRGWRAPGTREPALGFRCAR